MGDTPDAFTTVRIMGPATQAKSPASGRGDEESVSEAESQMSVSLHSFGDPQSPFSGLACILSLYNRGPSHCQTERTELKRGLSKDSQLYLKSFEILVLFDLGKLPVVRFNS